MALLHAALITLLGYSEGLYAAGRVLSEQVRILSKSVLYATILLCIAYHLQGAAAEVSVGIAAAGTLHFIALLAWRWENRKLASTRPNRHMRNVLIVGAGEAGQRMASYVEGHPEQGRAVCGFLDDRQPIDDRVIGRVSNLAYLARTGFVDEVVLAAPHDPELACRVLEEARRLHLDVEIVPDLFGCAPAEEEIERVGGLPVICLHEERLPAVGLFVKRALDVIGAGLALALLSPIFAFILVLIKLDSEGPVFYAAERVGRKGRLFRCYKFRTMVSNADDLKTALRKQNQRSGAFFKITGDPRITRVGRFLRRYSLDELPQLWNVLTGEMSLVGPRPHPLDDVTAYEIEHLARLDVTPGITGLWQVTARRDPSFERAIELDREYIRHWGLGMDMRVLLKTVLAVARGSGE
jgi:exopolysaccharide biosynthesis polyprenyl glycosylphosphotransferase